MQLFSSFRLDTVRIPGENPC